MQTKHNCFVTWLLLFTFSVTNAIPKRDVENLCKETTDATFCLTQIETDPRIAAARDLGDVLVIVISLSTIQMNEANAQINSVQGQYTGPNGRRRINACKNDYKFAAARFQTAWESALKKTAQSSSEALRMATHGTNAVLDCEKGWKMGGPAQNSPVTSYNTNVNKLYGIISLLAKKLGA